MNVIVSIPDEIGSKLKEGKTFQQLKAELGIGKSAAEFYTRLKRQVSHYEPSPSTSSADAFEQTKDDKGIHFTTRSADIKTLEEALDFSMVDLDYYEVDKYTINSWEVTMGAAKSKTGEPQTYTNYQVKVWLKPKGGHKIGLEDFMRRVKTVKPFKPVKRPRKTAGTKAAVMAEIGLYDHHFGMQAWKGECGDNYDLKIASNLYVKAVDHFLDQLTGYEVEKIIFPIGHDLFHINDQFNETPNGKNQLDVDGRIAKIIDTAQEAVCKALLRCLEVSEVEAIWVPGNHDPLTSMFMIKLLKAYFRDTPHMSVDDGADERKYREYGVSLLGFNHGHLIKPKQLPLVMLDDQPEAFARSRHREFHVGHTHGMNVWEFNVGQQLHACRVRTLPTLCRHDAYAHNKGYPKSGIAAETYLWHKDNGYHGHLNAPIEIL